MKPAPERLQLATYPFSTELDTRFGDMDVQAHLNNVALARLYEEARLRFIATLAPLGLRADGERPMLAEVAIRYLAQGRYPGHLVGASGVLRVGRTSYVIGQAMFQDGACIGIADVVIVWTKANRPLILPDAFRAVLETSLIAGTTAADA